MNVILYGLIIAASVLILLWKTIGRQRIAKNWVTLDWIMIICCIAFFGGGVTGNLSVALAGLFFSLFLWIVKLFTK
jgi:hypothetical protein